MNIRIKNPAQPPLKSRKTLDHDKTATLHHYRNENMTRELVRFIAARKAEQHNNTTS